MYTVQVEIVSYPESITYLPSESYEPEWSDLVTIPQLATEQEELKEARRVVRQCEHHYTSVRIVKSAPSGLRRIVL